MDNKKKILLGLGIVILVAVGVAAVILNMKKVEKINEDLKTTTTTTTTKKTEEKPIDVQPSVQKGMLVTSLEDTFKENAAWCGTFNMIWNDLRDNIAKTDIVWTQDEMTSAVKNLNKGTFTTKSLNESSYYKIYDHPSPELKTKIEKAIKDKFNQTSDILNEFDWTPSQTSWFLYTMLYKEFKSAKPFDKLLKAPFNGSTELYDYFGIDEESDSSLYKNITLRQYTDYDHFIVKLNTTGDDEIFVYKGFTETNFLDAYNTVKEADSKEIAYEFGEGDTFRMPAFKTNFIEEIDEVTNKPFSFSDGSQYIISKAMQTLKFELNNEGGKVKSEAAMRVDKSVAAPSDSKHLNVNKDFILFIREKGKDLPYVAIRVNDISLFK